VPIINGNKKPFPKTDTALLVINGPYVIIGSLGSYIRTNEFSGFIPPEGAGFV
jgi:hypothetical protein